MDTPNLISGWGLYFIRRGEPNLLPDEILGWHGSGGDFGVENTQIAAYVHERDVIRRSGTYFNG
jgi:hypothetical protein